jgi:energy-coupling factor transport system permease protein
MLSQVDSKLRHVDGRVGLIWIVALMLAGVVFVDVLSLAVILLGIIIIGAATGVLRPVIGQLKSLWAIVIVIGLIFGLTIPGEVLFYLIPPDVPWIGGLLPVTSDGLMLGFVSILRMFIFALPIVMFVISVDNSSLIRTLIYFRMPYDYALMIALALNFVPIYLSEFNRIMDAQRVRAHTLVDKGLIGKARGFIPIFVPLTLNAIERADTVGKVLELRGFARRKFAIEFDPLNRASVALAIISGIILVATVTSIVSGQSIIPTLLNPIMGQFPYH